MSAPASSQRPPSSPQRPPATGSRLAVHRDDGPLGLLAVGGALPVPQVLLLTLAVAVVGAAALPGLLGLLPGDVASALAARGPASITGWLTGTGRAPWWLAEWRLVAVALALAVLASTGRSLARLDWPIPALLRALEYGAVLVLVGSSPWTYALLATVAFHHYDIVYRVSLRGAGPPRWLQLATGGWPVRLAVLVVAAVLGVPETAAAALVVLLVPVYLGESGTLWLTDRGA